MTVFFLVFSFSISTQVLAATDQPDVFFRARVISITQESSTTTETGEVLLKQHATIKFEDGDRAGTTLEMDYGGVVSLREDQKLHEGDEVVVEQSTEDGKTKLEIIDHYRFGPIKYILAFFFLIVLMFGRIKGVRAIVGLVLSLVILYAFMAPAIVRGWNPLVASLIASVFIILTSFGCAHGWRSQRARVAILATVLSLLCSIGLAVFFVWLTRLSGVGTDEALYLQIGPLAQLNLRGLLLGGIIIGSLGVLDDVTSSQSAAIEEIHRANPHLPRLELYKRGLSVGHEHIAALVNTLVLAYVGAAFPLFLLLTNNDLQPLWVSLNSEGVVEEIVRTVVGSSALVIAVPLTTALASYTFSKKKT